MLSGCFQRIFLVTLQIDRKKPQQCHRTGTTPRKKSCAIIQWSYCPFHFYFFQSKNTRSVVLVAILFSLFKKMYMWIQLQNAGKVTCLIFTANPFCDYTGRQSTAANPSWPLFSLEVMCWNQPENVTGRVCKAEGLLEWQILRGRHIRPGMLLCLLMYGKCTGARGRHRTPAWVPVRAPRWDVWTSFSRRRRDPKVSQAGRRWYSILRHWIVWSRWWSGEGFWWTRSVTWSESIVRVPAEDEEVLSEPHRWQRIWKGKGGLKMQNIRTWQLRGTRLNFKGEKPAVRFMHFHLHAVWPWRSASPLPPHLVLVVRKV